VTERRPFRSINPAAPTPTVTSRSTKPSTASGSTSHGRSEWQTISPPPQVGEQLLTPGEVARILRVDPKTVTRWARTGQLTAITLPSGHRRYRESEIRTICTPRRETQP